MKNLSRKGSEGGIPDPESDPLDSKSDYDTCPNRHHSLSDIRFLELTCIYGVESGILVLLAVELGVYQVTYTSPAEVRV
jgi:hypothetical protein